MQPTLRKVTVKIKYFRTCLSCFGLIPTQEIQNPPPTLKCVQNGIKDAQCVETNEKTICRFLFFIIRDMVDYVFKIEVCSKSKLYDIGYSLCCFPLFVSVSNKSLLFILCLFIFCDNEMLSVIIRRNQVPRKSA